MTDIVKRLRDNNAPGTLEANAADEIERLREKVEILEAEIRLMKKLPEVFQ